jgi:hypothetical protein
MMRSFRFTRALPVIIAALALGPALRADDEPPLFPETPAASLPSPSPSPAAPGTSPAAPSPPATALKPAGPVVPLRKTLDFTRWQEMTPRERQTYVEGMTQAHGSLTARMRQEIGGDGRMSPEAMAAIVKFVDANYPKRPAAVYLKEMESLYLTTDGQKLPMLDCFLQAFRRANGS